MNKLGEREYIKGLADVLVEAYGNTLKEYGTDVKMAEAALQYLHEYLFFHSHDIPQEEFDEWKHKRDPTNIRHCVICGKEYYKREKHVCKK